MSISETFNLAPYVLVISAYCVHNLSTTPADIKLSKLKIIIFSVRKFIIMSTKNPFYVLYHLFLASQVYILVPPVRFELTTARSSASPCNLNSRVLFQAELRRHILESLVYSIYIIALNQSKIIFLG